MVDDDPKESRRNRSRSSSGKSNRYSGSGGGMGGGLGNVIGALLPILLRRPKLLIVLLVVGLLLYLFVGKGCTTDSTMNEGGGISNFFRGGEMDPEIYEETEIYEALVDNKKNPLPERVSLKEFCPTPLSQGKQGSCVAWASAYAARTILEARKTGQNPNSIKFSPAFMYNQISIDHRTCQGSYIKYAMDNMFNIGAVQFNEFKYDDSDCNRQPSQVLKNRAEEYKIKGFQRLTNENKGKAHEVLAMKQNLAKGSPVVIGMMVGGTFMSNMMGKEFWNPTGNDYYKQGFGGHAMCVIGYDDYYEGGSFLIMNSWGTEWGKGGFAWVRYSDFKEFNVEAYGLYPMGNANEKKKVYFTGSFGLELNDGKKNVSLRKAGDHYFETISKVAIGDKFKIEFTNNVECYTYVFGEETNGSSYVLFPYTAKHSPYCGITGTRLFPRDKSMVADDLGTKDKIAVIVTRKPIDYDAMNKAINSARGNDFQSKVQNAIGTKEDSGVTFNGSNLINFSTLASSNDYIHFVIGINK